MLVRRKPGSTRQALPHSTPILVLRSPGDGPGAGPCHSAVSHHTPLTQPMAGGGEGHYPCPALGLTASSKGGGGGVGLPHSRGRPQQTLDPQEGRGPRKLCLPPPPIHTDFPSYRVSSASRASISRPRRMVGWLGLSQSLIRPAKAFTVSNATLTHRRSKGRQAGAH